MRVEIRNLIKDAQGDRVGFIDVRIIDIGLELFGCELHEQGSKRWVRLPSKTYKKPNGYLGRNFMAKFFIAEDYRRFCESVFAELDKQLEKSESINALRELHSRGRKLKNG